ncbi:hypothetical protein DH2020_030075 [Rehmannia glutinosa]|uniref:Homeobox domain-containing protein n=1 Tax=Rehmannia glutinosa TaxID=99300 RepID=A0ABR0VQ00_REHGL
MEGGDQNHGNGPGGSRWNPTKEQINMLESLYKQGLRTPTAEQIQQITVRLRDFGHIEGKNVFYWFQNHKARQRQKQKQENFAYFNRFLHAAPVFPPYQNVVCSPCYIPKSDPGYYQQYPKVPLPTAAGVNFMKRSTIETRYNKSMQDSRSNHHHQETLDLFPIHPTGILQAAKNEIEIESIKNKSKSSSSATTPTSSENENYDHPFFDFFCKN